jgi:hypothetical protein
MLAKQTEIQIPPGIASITCHVAVWYWARRLAEAQGLVMGGVLEPKALLEKICGMEGGAQEAMKALPRSGQWDLKSPLLTPPIDTVLFWADNSSHSAVVTGTGRITGYNQACLKGLSPVGGFSTITPSEILPQFKLCFTIAEMTILKAAAAGRFGVYPG